MYSELCIYHMYTRAMYSSIHLLTITAYPLEGCVCVCVCVWGGGRSQSGRTLGERRGTAAWTDGQFITALTHGDKQPFMLTFAPTGSLESPINLRVFGLWEEAPRGNPHTEREHQHGKLASRFKTQNSPAVRRHDKYCNIMWMPWAECNECVFFFQPDS